VQHIAKFSTVVWLCLFLQAAEKADGGPVWASVSFNMPTDDVSTKSNIYNTLVADAALEAISNAVRQCQLIKKQVCGLFGLGAVFVTTLLVQSHVDA
jgi:hypothetical protein